MNAATVATLLTAIGGFIFGGIAAVSSFLARRDAREKEESAVALALRTASREDLEAVIGAQRVFIADSEAQYGRVSNALATTVAKLTEAEGKITVLTERVAHLEQQVVVLGGTP